MKIINSQEFFGLKNNNQLSTIMEEEGDWTSEFCS